MEFLQLAYEALKERKVRATLTIFMVIIGSALLIAVDGLSNGTKTYIEGEFEKFGTNLVVVTRKSQDFEIKDWFVDELKKMDGVVDAVPFIEQTVAIYSRGKTRSVIVSGIDQSKLHYVIPKLEIEEGTLVSETDTIGIVLGNQVAYGTRGEIFAWIGQTVQLIYTKVKEGGERETIRKSFVVRGVFKYLGSYFIPVDQVVWISLRAAEILFDRSGTYDGVYVITEDPDLNKQIMEEIKENYDVDVLTPQAIKEMVDRVMSTLTFFISSISFVSLLVASIGIITTLYTSMLERIREIGILKAIGFRRIHILKMFLYEAAIIGMVGGSLGLVLGVLMAIALKNYFFAQVPFITPIFTPGIFIEIWSMATILSIISGLYPAWRAAQLDPVVALKYE